jgi:hypothetical protein
VGYYPFGPASATQTVLSPSGDPTGAADTARVQAALAAGAAPVLGPGIWFITNVSMVKRQQVKGSGRNGVTTVYKVGAAGPAFSAANSGGYDTSNSVALLDMDIDGTYAAPGSQAFQLGDMPRIQTRVNCLNFTGAGSRAGTILNANWFSEQGDHYLYVSNCDGGFVLDQSGAGTNSFDRTCIKVNWNQQAAQKGLVLAGSTVGAQLLGGTYEQYGNWNSAATAGGSTISFTHANANITSCRLFGHVESNGAGAATARTVQFLDPSTVIANCTGLLEFYNGGTNFTASNNGVGGGLNVYLNGGITGDDTLVSNVLPPPHYAKITTGFPAGWSGEVEFSLYDAIGLVFIQVTMAIAATTVVTAYETVVAPGNIPAWAMPADSRIAVSDSGNGVYTPFILSLANGLRYVGPAYGSTPAGVFPYGQALYSKIT